MAFGPIVVTVIIAVALMALILIWRRLNKPTVLDFPSCGECRYDVTGLTTQTCPECGSDLRAVGVLPAGKGAPAPWWVLGLILGAVLAIPTFISFAVLDQLLPKQTTATCSLTFTGPQTSAAVAAVVIEGRETSWDSAFDVFPNTGRLYDGTGAEIGAPLTLDLKRGDVTIGDQGVRRLDATSLGAWVRTADPLLDDADATALGEQIADTLREPEMQSPTLVFGSGTMSANWSSTSTAEPFQRLQLRRNTLAQHSPFFKPIFFTFWMLVWILGVILIRKGRPTVARP